MPWFGSIGLFRHTFKNANAVPQFEERVVILRSKNRSTAKRKVLSEYRSYAKTAGIEFLKEFTLDELSDAPGLKVVEVTSLMRASNLSRQDYLKKHWFDLKPRSCTDVEWKHAWHNKGGKISGCYNCSTVRKGELWK
jgi:hypothetical protein